MKPTRTFLVAPRIASLCGLLILSPTGLVAAETRPVPPPPGYTVAKADDPWERRLKELRLDGVPLMELMRFLEEKFPEVNFVLTPGDDDPSVSLNLRGVTLDDIFMAVNLATRGRVQATKVTDRMVNLRLLEAPPTEPAPRKICRAFSLSRYLSGRSNEQMDLALKDLEDALERCRQMLQEANPGERMNQELKLSLHRTTKLLLAVGLPEQLAVVEEVVNQLEGVPSSVAIDPATGLPVAGGGGGYGGGGGRSGGGYGGGISTGLDPAMAEAFRRRYGIAPSAPPAAPASPVPLPPPAPGAPSTNRPGSGRF